MKLKGTAGMLLIQLRCWLRTVFTGYKTRLYGRAV